ncbi:MAG: hypothetical protein AAF636_01980 [Pseudomonadota bacterium]
MTNYFEAARAGRIKALKEREERRATIDAFCCSAELTAEQRRYEMPVFTSARARAYMPTYLH